MNQNFLSLLSLFFAANVSSFNELKESSSDSKAEPHQWHVSIDEASFSDTCRTRLVGHE